MRPMIDAVATATIVDSPLVTSSPSLFASSLGFTGKPARTLRKSGSTYPANFVDVVVVVVVFGRVGVGVGDTFDEEKDGVADIGGGAADVGASVGVGVEEREEEGGKDERDGGNEDELEEEEEEEDEEEEVV